MSCSQLVGEVLFFRSGRKGSDCHSQFCGILNSQMSKSSDTNNSAGSISFKPSLDRGIYSDTSTKKRSSNILSKSSWKSEDSLLLQLDMSAVSSEVRVVQKLPLSTELVVTSVAMITVSTVVSLWVAANSVSNF